MDDTVRSRHISKVLLFVNPNSRTGEENYQVISQALLQQGIEILNKDNHEKDIHPNEIILKYQHSAQAVVAGGGDGTVNLILPGLAKSKLPLLVIPLGTANNLARTYNLPSQVQQALDSLKSPEMVAIDLGEVNGILFVNVVGLGLSTEINSRVSSRLKKHLGVLAFILTALRLIFRMNPFRASITSDGSKKIQTKSWQISVCNGKHYGAGMIIKHNATLEDAKLHCLSTEVKKWWQGFALIPSLMSGHYKKEQEITLLSGREFVIETHRVFHIDVDGDVKTKTPAHIKVLPKALNLIVPSHKPI